MDRWRFSVDGGVASGGAESCMLGATSSGAGSPLGAASSSRATSVASAVRAVSACRCEMALARRSCSQ